MIAKIDKYLIYITYTVALAFILFNYKEVLSILFNIISLATPLYIGVVIAYILNIPMRQFEKLLSKNIDRPKVARAVSIGITLLCAVILIALFSSFIVPRLIESVTIIFSNLFNYTSSLIRMANEFLQSLNINYSFSTINIENAIENNIDINSIISTVTNWLGKTGINIVFQSMGLVSVVINFGIGFVISIYLLANKELYITQLKKFITFVFGYRNAKYIVDIGTEANHYFNGFISGQLLEACIFATEMFVVLGLLKIPFSELIAVIVGFCSLVPMFGTAFAFCIGFILVLATEPNMILIYSISYICVQQFEANVVFPHVVGDAVGLRGLYVVVSLVVFGNLFGFIGLLIAVPCMAVIYAVGSRTINLSLYRNNIEVTLNKITHIKDEKEEQEKENV